MSPASLGQWATRAVVGRSHRTIKDEFRSVTLEEKELAREFVNAYRQCQDAQRASDTALTTLTDEMQRTNVASREHIPFARSPSPMEQLALSFGARWPGSR